MRLRTATRATVEPEPPRVTPNAGSERGSDCVTALRQRMRLHPSTKGVTSHPDVTLLLTDPDLTPQSIEDLATNTPRRAIVSINGVDVDEEFLVMHKTA